MGYWLYQYFNLTPIPTSPSPETMTVKIYFGNINFNPNMQGCSQVHPVERTIPKTLGVAKASLEELFKGPSEEKNPRIRFMVL